MWVFLRFDFSDSVMDKIAFNDPYRFVVAIFRGAKTLLKKEAGLTVRLWVGDPEKFRVTREKTQRGDCSSSLAN
jgi:hypothetical protein